MLLCKGKGCRYRKTCQRYVLGLAIERLPKPATVLTDGKCDQWIDHCLHTSKYEKVEQPQNGSYPRGC